MCCVNPDTGTCRSPPIGIPQWHLDVTTGLPHYGTAHGFWLILFLLCWIWNILVVKLFTFNSSIKERVIVHTSPTKHTCPLAHAKMWKKEEKKTDLKESVTKVTNFRMWITHCSSLVSSRLSTTVWLHLCDHPAWSARRRSAGKKETELILSPSSGFYHLAKFMNTNVWPHETILKSAVTFPLKN